MVTGVILGLVSAFVWATTSLIIKAQSDRIDTSSFNAFRMFVAGILAIALLPFFGGVQSILQMPLSATLWLALSSIIGIAMGDTLYFWGLTKIGASRALPISGTYPLFTWALAIPLLGEKITMNALLGTALVVLGVYFLAPRAEPTIHADARTERLAILGTLLAAFLWAIATTMFKVGLQESPDVIVVNAIRIPIAAIGAAIIAYRRKGLAAWHGYNRQALPGLILLAIYSTGIGMILWTLTVDYVGAARAALINTAAPIMGVPLSAIFLKENVTPKVAMGTLLSVVGIWFII